MPQEQSNRRILSHIQRAVIEKTVTEDIGELLDDTGYVADNMSYTWDKEKGVLIAELYSDNGGAIEFYEVRPVVSYVGNGRHSDDA